MSSSITKTLFYILDQPSPGSPEDREAGTEFLEAIDPATGTTRRGTAPTCPQCGAYIGMLAWLPPYEGDLECCGRVFGDLVWGVGDDFLVSERLKVLYEGQDLTGLYGFDPVKVLRVKRRSRLRGDPPQYYRVSAVRSRAAIDLPASGFVLEAPVTCDECRKGENLKRFKRIVIEAGTWSGEDIFVPRGLSVLMTSERFKEFCEAHGITNAVFVRAEDYCVDYQPWDNYEKAQELMSRPAGGDLLEIRYSDGRILRYERSTRYFVALDAGGRLCTVSLIKGEWGAREIEQFLQNPPAIYWRRRTGEAGPVPAGE